MAIGDPPLTVDHLMRKVRQAHTNIKAHRTAMTKVSAAIKREDSERDIGGEV